MLAVPAPAPAPQDALLAENDSPITSPAAAPAAILAAESLVYSPVSSPTAAFEAASFLESSAGAPSNFFEHFLQGYSVGGCGSQSWGGISGYTTFSIPPECNGGYIEGYRTNFVRKNYILPRCASSCTRSVHRGVHLRDRLPGQCARVHPGCS